MKKCEMFRGEFSALIDGELPSARQTAVQAHLDACPGCREEVAGLRLLSTGISALPQAQPPPKFLADVRRKIRQGKPVEHPWRELVLRPLPLGALSVLLLAAVIFAVRPASIRPASQFKPVTVAEKNDEPEFPPIPPFQGTVARILPEESTADKGAGSADFRSDTNRPADSTAAPGFDDQSPFQASELSLDGAQRSQPRLVVGNNNAPQAPQPLIVSGEALVDVKLRAETIARSLNGRFDSVTPSNTLLVSLPQSKVNAFRTQMAKAGHKHSATVYGTVSPSASGGAGSPSNSAAVSKTVTNLPLKKIEASKPAEPVVEVEVVVEPTGSKSTK